MLHLRQTVHFFGGDPFLSHLSHQNTPLHQFSRFVQNLKPAFANRPHFRNLITKRGRENFGRSGGSLGSWVVGGTRLRFMVDIDGDRQRHWGIGPLGWIAGG